jgi:hypothetical protein
MSEIDYEKLAKAAYQAVYGANTLPLSLLEYTKASRAVIAAMTDQGLVVVASATLKSLADEAIGISIGLNPDDDWESNYGAEAIARLARKIDALVAAPGSAATAPPDGGEETE